jgi:hypothetical protein
MNWSNFGIGFASALCLFFSKNQKVEMNNNQIASIGFIIACLGLSAFSQNMGSFLCLAVSMILYGFTLWLERRDENKFKVIEEQIEELSHRLQNIQMASRE